MQNRIIFIYPLCLSLWAALVSEVSLTFIFDRDVINQFQEIFLGVVAKC